MTIKSRYLSAVALICVFSCAAVCASTWRLGLLGDGGALLISKKRQPLTLAPGLVNEYASKNTENFVLGGGFDVAYDLPINSVWHTLFGIRGEYFRAPDQNNRGVVHPLINQGGNFDRLDYHYKMANYLLLGNVRWLWALRNSVLHPYVNMGVGVAWDHLFDYTEVTPDGSTAAPMRTPFRGRTRSQLAYGFGIGVERLKKNVGMQIGYEFLALGRGQLGTTSVQSTNEVLKTKPIYMHLFELAFDIVI